MRPISKISAEWWDYTTLHPDLLDEAAHLKAEDLLKLARPGFTVKFYDTREDFYLAEALEYITAWKQATPDRPAGICGPIGPTEQLPLVARLVNELELDLKHAHFWGMDEWLIDGKEAASTSPCRSPRPTWTFVSTAFGRSCGCRRRTSTSPRSMPANTRPATTRLAASS